MPHKCISEPQHIVFKRCGVLARVPPHHRSQLLLPSERDAATFLRILRRLFAELPAFWSFPCSPSGPLFFSSFPTPPEGKVSSDSNLPTPITSERHSCRLVGRSLSTPAARQSSQALCRNFAGVFLGACSLSALAKVYSCTLAVSLSLTAAFVSPPTSQGVSNYLHCSRLDEIT